MRWFVAVGLVIVSSHAVAETFYVDSAAAAGGTGSQASPWRGLSDIAGVAPSDTVLFKRGGTWSEALVPVSGAAGSPVAYGAWGTGARPVIAGFSAEGKSYVTVEELHFETSNYANAVLLRGSDHITFTNCEMVHSGTAWCGVLLEGSSYNRLSGCTIRNDTTSRQADTMDIALGSSNNVVEGCTLSGGTHSTLSLNGAADGAHYDDVQRYNVIRNNTIENTLGRPLEIMTRADWNLVEGNTVVGGRDTQSTTGFCVGGQNFKMVTGNNIVRRNVLRDSDGSSQAGLGVDAYRYGGYPPNLANDNHVYHNTFVNLAVNPISIRTYEPGVCTAERNRFVNNVVAHDSTQRVLFVENQYAGVSDNRFQSNLFFAAGASQVLRVGTSSYSVAEVQAALPGEFADNVQGDPNLDADFRPTGVPLVDTGAALTHVTSASGSGTVFVVADAGFFTAGFGVVGGDTIVVGTTTVTVSAVDYTTNTITATADLSWTVGDPVRLPFAGAAPDIGAFEIGLLDGGAADATGQPDDAAAVDDGGGSPADAAAPDGAPTDAAAGDAPRAGSVGGTHCGCAAPSAGRVGSAGVLLLLVPGALGARRRTAGRCRRLSGCGHRLGRNSIKVRERGGTITSG